MYRIHYDYFILLGCLPILYYKSVSCNFCKICVSFELKITIFSRIYMFVSSWIDTILAFLATVQGLTFLRKKCYPTSTLKRDPCFRFNVCIFLGWVYTQSPTPSAYIRRQLRLKSSKTQNSNQSKFDRINVDHYLIRFLRNLYYD